MTYRVPGFTWHCVVLGLLMPIFHGFETTTSTVLFVKGQCVDIRWLVHSKHSEDTSAFDLFVLGMPNRGFLQWRNRGGYW
jgi:hypothetical protein